MINTTILFTCIILIILIIIIYYYNVKEPFCSCTGFTQYCSGSPAEAEKSYKDGNTELTLKGGPVNTPAMPYDQFVQYCKYNNCYNKQ
jgi:hypothetical protein